MSAKNPFKIHYNASCINATNSCCCPLTQLGQGVLFHDNDRLWGETETSHPACWDGVGNGTTDSLAIVFTGTTTVATRYVLVDVALSDAGADVLEGGEGNR